jgi:putative Mg2+ transporter-C (MgtC) family protein
VALAAATYTVLTLEIFHLPEVMSGGRSDPVHAVEAVTAGIAFLGAGVLFRGATRPHGLTTAAGMWLADAAGMTAALGYYPIGVFVCVLAIVVLLGLKAIERKASPQRRPGDDEADDGRS